VTAIPLFEAESTLTDRYQTTVPEPVRLALKLTKRDKVRYALRPDGSVVLTRAEQAEEADPVLGQFLEFMARDLAHHPERLQSIDRELVGRIQTLVAHVNVDLDTPLSPDDE
jgi:antitoxin PrlF